MKYYAIENNGILIAENQEALKYYKNVQVLPEDYELNKYIVVDGVLVLNPDFEIQKANEEQQRIAMLNLTGADVERGIYKAKGMDFDDIIELVKSLNATTPEEGTEGYPKIDVKALKIELKANNFYRGNPYVDAVGSLLGFTKEQLDAFFETGDFIYLMEKEELISEDEIPF